MNLFDQFKQIKQMKDVQDKIGQERATVERDGVKVVVNGKMELEELILNPSLAAEEQQKLVKDCINEAMKQIQTEAAKQFMQMQG